MHYLYIPQQIPGNNTWIILEETGKIILELLGKKNKQSFINAVALVLNQKMLSHHEMKLDWCIYNRPRPKADLGKPKTGK